MRAALILVGALACTGSAESAPHAAPADAGSPYHMTRFLTEDCELPAGYREGFTYVMEKSHRWLFEQARQTCLLRLVVERAANNLDHALVPIPQVK